MYNLLKYNLPSEFRDLRYTRKYVCRCVVKLRVKDISLNRWSTYEYIQLSGENSEKFFTIPNTDQYDITIIENIPL